MRTAALLSFYPLHIIDDNNLIRKRSVQTIELDESYMKIISSKDIKEALERNRYRIAEWYGIGKRTRLEHIQRLEWGYNEFFHKMMDTEGIIVIYNLCEIEDILDNWYSEFIKCLKKGLE